MNAYRDILPEAKRGTSSSLYSTRSGTATTTSPHTRTSRTLVFATSNFLYFAEPALSFPTFPFSPILLATDFRGPSARPSSRFPLFPFSAPQLSPLHLHSLIACSILAACHC